MKKIFLSLLILAMGVLTISCQTTTIQYDIYVTVYPLQYMSEEILKSTTITVGIVPGVTSHQDSVDWSPKEIIAMTQAVYLIYVGANYDQYIDHQIESIFANKPVELVKIETENDYIEYIPGIIDNHDHDTETTTESVSASDTLGLDPHFWISPERMIQVAQLLYDKLMLKYPDLETILTANYDQLIINLQALSDAFTNVISNQNKIVLFSTNLYGYLRNDYGLEYLSISPGYHEETEQFTSQEKEEIVSDAISYQITYVIYERYTSSPLSNAVFTELVSRGALPVKLEYDILQSLTNEEKSLGKTYITIMYDNLELIKLAVGYIEE